MSIPTTPSNSQSTRRGLFANSPSPGQACDSVPVANIGTFVFMKCHVSNVNNQKLTELAMVAVDKCDIVRQGSGEKREDGSSMRYRDILVLTFDPDVIIQEQDSANSDLTLEQLKVSNKKALDKDAVHEINGFLKEQRTPICLLAHGGHAIDFRILSAELQKLNMCIFRQNNNDLLCADTMTIFWQQDMGAGVPKVPDFGRYSFENVFRRFFGKFPSPYPRSAKFYALCLLEIFLKPNAFVLDEISTKNVTAIGADSELTKNSVSPSKRGRVEEIGFGDGSPLAPSLEFSGMVPSDAPPEAIKTFVFFDLETTGLDTAKDCIIELCMVAVHRTSLSFLGDVRCNDFDYNQIIPRVTDECNYMVFPLSDMTPEASSITGISKDMLELRMKNTFSVNTANNLTSFLARQAKPVCLVAHNGWKFDFPMLIAHLRRTQACGVFWNEIYCSDSLQGLRELRTGARSNALGSVFNDVIGPRGRASIAAPAHSAEGDVLRLIVVARLCEGLVQWLEQNKKLFIEREPPL